jgi:glyoxylase-like metal-dependent hydrolase (beta-lactamase superfamily II)
VLLAAGLSCDVVRAESAARAAGGTAPAAAAARRAERALAPAGAAAVPGPALDVVRVRDNVYLLAGPAANTAVFFGSDGTMVVNTQSAALAPEILATIARLTPQPIRYILNTSADAQVTGGNVVVTRAGRFVSDRTGEREAASIVAHENVLARLTEAAGAAGALPSEGWPEDVYFKSTMDMRFNGEAVQLLYQPAAHSDGDSAVFLRGADVIITGELFLSDAYPVVDLAHGGTVQGVIDALNRLIDIAVPDFNEEGGTMIIPGHGRVTDEYDLVVYRDMLTIVHDRVRDLVAQGMTLAQVVAAQPTRDYDGIYASAAGPSSPAKFVETLYADAKRAISAGAQADGPPAGEKGKP